MNNKNPFDIAAPRPSVIGTGLLALDVVLNSDASRPSGRWTGGTCGNVLTILSYLGWGAYPIARLNGDAASKHVLRDLIRWGVRLEFATTEPGADTPIVIHKICRNAAGQAIHRFSLNCPYCGAFLPTYKAVLASAAQDVAVRIRKPKVFFMDRVSRGSLILAKACSDKGALIIFEPPGVGDPHLFKEALALTHILKYSHERGGHFKDLLLTTKPLLEIETLGEEGLRFRSRLAFGRTKGWHQLNSYKVTLVRDAAGAGDWCTAGIIHRLGQRGLTDFLKTTTAVLHDAFNFGQAMAAWTCQYEGARGGMYSLDKKSFRSEIFGILLRDAADLSAPAPVNVAKVVPIDSVSSSYKQKGLGARTGKTAQSGIKSPRYRAACCF